VRVVRFLGESSFLVFVCHYISLPIEPSVLWLCWLGGRKGIQLTLVVPEKGPLNRYYISLHIYNSWQIDIAICGGSYYFDHCLSLCLFVFEIIHDGFSVKFWKTVDCGKKTVG